MMNYEKAQAWLLRLTGATEILAFIAVIMPRTWMETSHMWLNLGSMPGGPLIDFMIRQASYVYGMHGVSLLVIASDVKRFRPLVIFNGVSFLLAGPVFFLIDYSSGMPIWWTVSDSLACFVLGATQLWLNQRIGRDT